jgi:hypothetical protein
MSRPRPAAAAAPAVAADESAAGVEETPVVESVEPEPEPAAEPEPAVESEAPAERTRALIDVPVIALGAPGTVAKQDADGNWYGAPAGAE